MEHLIIPEGYEPALNLHDTQIAIKTVKDFFQDLLAKQLNLLRVSAPLFVTDAQRYRGILVIHYSDMEDEVLQKVIGALEEIFCNYSEP